MFCHQTYYIPKVSIVVPFVGLDIDIAIFALRVLYKLPPQNRNYNGDFRFLYAARADEEYTYIDIHTYMRTYIQIHTYIYIER